MKTKFIVSSSSGLNFIKHKSNIDVINYYICYNGYELYEDFIEMKYDEFYIRLKYDSNSDITFKDIQYEDFDLRIKNYFNNGFENIIFILNENESRLLEFINSYKIKNIDANIDVIITSLNLYPLAYSIIESEKIYNDTNDINEIYQTIKSIENKSKFYIYVPLKTLYQEISSIEYDEDVTNTKGGYLCEYSNNGIPNIKKSKNHLQFKYMLDSYIKEVDGKDIIPFILYTESNSRFVSLIKKRLLSNDIIKKEKDIILGYLDSKIGSQYGPNSLVLGFIMK